MSDPANKVDRVLDLAEAVCSKEASESDFAELDSLLRANPESRSRYLNYCWMHVALRLQLRARRAAQRAYEQIDFDSVGPASSGSDAARDGTSAALPYGVLSDTLRGSVGYFSSGWPMAYLVATVIFGVGMLIGFHIYVSPPMQVANSSLPAPPIATAMDSVGRITGVADCQWAGGTVPLLANDPVSLGCELKLESGLVEIAYHSGAKVILQGPVTYRVESAAGGYLSLGKLTAKVDEGSKIRDERSRIPHPSSLIPHPLFSVRTPTAVITDLGTEFGIVVDRAGLTQLHVLQGVVEAQAPGRQGTAQRLTEGMAIGIGRERGQFKAVEFAPQSFARKLQPVVDTPAEAAYIKAVLADKPLGYWPLNEPVGARRFSDRSGNGFVGYAVKTVQAGDAGPLQDGRAVLLKGDGYIDVGRHGEFGLVRDFSAEAWVAIDRMAWFGRILSVASNRQGEPPSFFGWAVSAMRPGHPGDATPVGVNFSLYHDTVLSCSLSGNVVPENSWGHLVVVFDRTNTAHFYVNGERRQSIQGNKLPEPGSVWISIGGEPGFDDVQPWRGRIAHVAVYSHVLTAEQIRNHYNYRNQSKAATGK
jgi:hypothetical protein